MVQELRNTFWKILTFGLFMVAIIELQLWNYPTPGQSFSRARDTSRSEISLVRRDEEFSSPMTFPWFHEAKEKDIPLTSLLLTSLPLHSAQKNDRVLKKNLSKAISTPLLKSIEKYIPLRPHLLKTDSTNTSEILKFETNESDISNQHQRSLNGDFLPQHIKTIKDRFSRRNSLTAKACGNNYRKRHSSIQSNTQLIDICVCRKTGSSFIKQIMADIEKHKKQTAIPKQRSKRVVVVRDPYSRLVSGYVDRIFLKAGNWTPFNESVIRMFWPKAAGRDLKCGTFVSFPKFIRYFIFSHRSGLLIDAHFRLIHQQCNPCKRPFDYIVRLESIEEDMSYILNGLHLSIDLNLSKGIEKPMLSKSRTLKENEDVIKECVSMCTLFYNLWWSFKIRGFIARGLEFPLSENECNSISGDDFAQLSWRAHLMSVNTFDKIKQQREMTAELFLQVSLKDRIKVKNLLAVDCHLFGYNPQPEDFFPELVRGKLGVTG